MKQADVDLKDSPADEAKLQPEYATIDMPEVKDIPGQENVHPPKMNQFADTTVSSDDEEGVGILDELNEPQAEDDELIAGDDAEIPNDNDDDDEVPHDEDEAIEEDDSNVTEEEKKLLDDTDYTTTDEDDMNLQRSGGLDDTDDDGDPLEEKSFKDDVTGSDLDVPGSEDDDADEAVGDEDEENNAYSGDSKNETK